MTLPVFTNNASTTLDADTTTNATIISVTDASIFNVDIQNGSGSSRSVHEMATLTNGVDIEIVKVTNADTSGNDITVVREQEGTSGFAFVSGDDIELRLTAGVLERGFFGVEAGVNSAPLGPYAVDLVTFRASADHRAGGDDSIAIGYRAGAKNDSIAIGRWVTSGAGCIAIGDNINTTAKFNTVAVGAVMGTPGGYGVCIGYTAHLRGEYSLSIGYQNDIDGSYSTGVGTGTDIGAGTYSCVYGALTTSSASYATSLGAKANTTNTYATAVGYLAQATAISATSLGEGAQASGSSSTALGMDSRSRIEKTHNTTGPSIVRKDITETDEVLFFSAQENVIFSEEVSLLSTGTNKSSITIPAGSHFFVDEVGFVVTSSSGVTVQPEISFGDASTPALILAATLTVAQDAQQRDVYKTLLNNNGHQSLTMSVTTAATATTMLGRIYFKGILVEDE